ncbi:hypothetical protein Tco_0375631 [Tanacetum coccineum]
MLKNHTSTVWMVFPTWGSAISLSSKKQTMYHSVYYGKSKFVALAATHVLTMAKAYSQVYNGKSGHIGVRHSMVRELIRNGVISIEFVRTQHNLADHLTKGLARDLESRHIDYKSKKRVQALAEKEKGTEEPAQALAELKSTKPKVVTTAATTTTIVITMPKAKGLVIQEQEQASTPITSSSKDKGKGIMVEEPLKMKKKDQVSFDQQEAIRLQA